jgi:type IV secretion system protein TrbI
MSTRGLLALVAQSFRTIFGQFSNTKVLGQPSVGSCLTAANPYVEARRQWDERYADRFLGKPNWQIAAGGLLAATLASPYAVVAGSVIPPVLNSRINSDLPGPILAQVSHNLFDRATGKDIVIPQENGLIGPYQNVSTYWRRRLQIAWQRLIFPNTSSMNLPQMPGTNHSYAGFADQVNNHYLAPFRTAALMSLICAGQMVGQMTAFGGGGTYGPYGYYQPNQWAMAGSAASDQFGGRGQQTIGNGLNRPPTIEIRPGNEFNFIVTKDLVFTGSFGK